MSLLSDPDCFIASLFSQHLITFQSNNGNSAGIMQDQASVKTCSLKKTFDPLASFPSPSNPPGFMCKSLR